MTTWSMTFLLPTVWAMLLRLLAFFCRRRFYGYGLVHSIESMGLVDGPGIRTVVFLQGCRMRCLFCHNPDTWPEQSKTARSMTSQELIDKVLRFKPYFGSKGGITFSGGEPLLQPDFLIDCLKQCKDAGLTHV